MSWTCGAAPLRTVYALAANSSLRDRSPSRRPRGVNASASDPITFGGQTLDAAGSVVGQRVTEPVHANGGGDFALLLPAASIAIVELPSQ